MSEVKVYGADWCHMTTGTLAHLKQIGVPFNYINIEFDHDAARWVAEQNGGKEKKPTVDIDGEILAEPSDEELDGVLVEKGLLAR